jgi:hypothetical protein
MTMLLQNLPLNGDQINVPCAPATAHLVFRLHFDTGRKTHFSAFGAIQNRAFLSSHAIQSHRHWRTRDIDQHKQSMAASSINPNAFSALNERLLNAGKVQKSGLDNISSTAIKKSKTMPTTTAHLSFA